MARRKHSPVVETELDERAAARRLQRIMVGLIPHAVPESPERLELEKVTAALLRFRGRLDQEAIPLTEQLPLIERWLEERGLIDRVMRHVDSMEDAEARWKTWG